MDTNILSQLTRPSNGKQPNADNRINGNHRPTVTAANHLKTDSGLIIPKGTAGILLEVNRHGLAFVDFGAFPVFALQFGSPLVHWPDLAGGAK